MLFLRQDCILLAEYMLNAMNLPAFLESCVCPAFRRSVIQAAAASAVFPLFHHLRHQSFCQSRRRERPRACGRSRHKWARSIAYRWLWAGQPNRNRLPGRVDTNLYKSRIQAVKKASGSEKEPVCVQDVRRPWMTSRSTSFP